MKAREGLVLKWYADSLGKITGGYGHLQRPQDKGLTVTKELAEKWLIEDMQTAEQAARNQALQMGRCSQEIYDVLISVNFQLGVNWTNKFKVTWGHLKAGRLDEAAWEAENSLWAKQTPVRVRDLQRALWSAY